MGVRDYVLWPLVGRLGAERRCASGPPDLFRRAGTLGVPQTLCLAFGGPFALPREIPHLPTRATRVGRTRVGRILPVAGLAGRVDLDGPFD